MLVDKLELAAKITVATKNWLMQQSFYLLREAKESSKHKQQLLIGVQFLMDWLSANKLSIWQMPFFLLAVGEKERYYVNLQKEYVATPGGAYYQISVQGEL